MAESVIDFLFLTNSGPCYLRNLLPHSGKHSYQKAGNKGNVILPVPAQTSCKEAEHSTEKEGGILAQNVKPWHCWVVSKMKIIGGQEWSKLFQMFSKLQVELQN